jgi:phosphatidate cytidylyltransferase
MFPFFDAGIRLTVAMSALYGLLAAASLSVRMATRGRAPGMLSHQVNAWWRIFPIVTLALLAYPLGVTLLAGLVYVLAVLELTPHYPGSATRFRLGAAAVAVVAMCLHRWLPAAVPFLWPAAIAVQFLQWRTRPGAAGMIRLLLLATGGAMHVLVAFSTLPFGARTNLAWLFYLFILTALNDIGQFVAGKLFGQHKIAPTVSPNKTWQGLAGGIAVSQCVSLALGTYLSLAGPVTLAAYGLLLSLAGFAGDLVFSKAKRSLSIKDFSQLIPGHGGILDRVDSLVLTAPLLYCLLRSFP